MDDDLSARRRSIPDRRRLRRQGAAWLAVFTLLLGVLFPTAVTLAAPPDRVQTASGFCGTPAAPEHSPTAVLGHQCVLCCIAAIGLEPAPSAWLAARRSAEPADLAMASVDALPRLPFAVAQPRGPPVAA
ncbi:MAG TPA: hypothetical protein VHW90_05730 [Stellaceae bacterium]|nr:hypothetical protein [Stellaceae bacterium]